MSDLTKQEQKFADDYVFLYFHAGAVTSGIAVEAARYAGYDIPDDVSKADAIAKTLLHKANIEKYIDAEIQRFREILSGQQRRNLWQHISEFVAGEPEQNTLPTDYGNIIRH